MIADIEIKVKLSIGYSVTYKIWDVLKDDEDEKDFSEKCELALIDSFRVAGINKRNLPK
jgi:hypothetical protein